MYDSFTTAINTQRATTHWMETLTDNMMNQYTPVEAVAEDKLLCRRVTKREYGRLLDYASEIGVTQGFYQEGETAKESFIPAFDCEGVLPK